MPDGNPTRADAFEGGRDYYPWVEEIHKKDVGEDIVAADLLFFLEAMKLDPDQIRALIRSEPPKMLELGPNFFRKPKAEAKVSATIHSTDSTLTPWFEMGKCFSQIEADALANKQEADSSFWATTFRRAMEDSGISASDRDTIVNTLRTAVTATDRAPSDRFEPAAERVRDCARKIAMEKIAMTPTVGPPPAPTSMEKLAFLISILVFAGGGFYLFQANLWLAFLWFIFFVVAFPLVWAFISRAEAVSGADLITMYQTGVRSIPGIGKLLFSSRSATTAATGAAASQTAEADRAAPKLPKRTPRAK